MDLVQNMHYRKLWLCIYPLHVFPDPLPTGLGFDEAKAFSWSLGWKT